MRVRKGPLLWLLLPALTTSASVPKQAAGDDSPVAIAEGSSANRLSNVDTTVASGSAPTANSGILGTKDAPVDGLDGKPHAGPWVGTEPDYKKKLKAEVEDLGPKTVPKGVERLEREGFGSHSSLDGWQLIPEKNDGVMDDSNRAAPKKGTTGTEGGISEKNKQTKQQELGGDKATKKPDSPKEPRPLPHSEQEAIKDSSDGKVSKDKLKSKTSDSQKDKTDSTDKGEKPKGAQGLEKPTDLPESPKDKTSKSSEKSEPDPNARSASSSSSHVLLDTMPHSDGSQSSTSSSPATSLDEPPEGLIQPLHSFVLSLIMILFSEVGDKTFLVAALMAMRHDRLVVFSAAFSALICMTVLSAVLGHVVPELLPRKVVAFAAALLFLVFGAKMMREGLKMPKDSGVGEEMKEVEAELEEKEELARKTGRRRSELTPYVLESGRGRRSGSRTGIALAKPARSPSSSDDEDGGRGGKGGRGAIGNALAGINNLFSLVLSPAWVQTFVMTFIGEWGDRSQIATIAMAAGQDYWWVTGGAVVGHACCTGVAVIGGRALAGRVSMRVVTIGGAGAFLVFGVIYLVEAAYSEMSPLPH